MNGILSINAGHDASVVYMEDGNISWMIEEERYSHLKHDGDVVLSLYKHGQKMDPFSDVLFSYPQCIHLNDNVKYNTRMYGTLVQKALKKEGIPIKDYSKDHHLYHAAIGFYNSGFEEAVCLIVDGAGAYIDDCGNEVETIYKASYPNKFTKLHQRGIPLTQRLDDHTLDNPTIGMGMVYSGIADYMGFGHLGCGTLMGLAPFGEENEDIQSFLDDDGEIINDCWTRSERGVNWIPQHPFVKRPPLFDNIKNPNAKFKIYCDLAYRLQKDFETYMISLIKKSVEISGCKNIVLSGGCALNCVANYEYLKHLPEGCKLYVEPICYDAGLSVGQAALWWRQKTKSTEIKPLETLYLGPPQKHVVPDESYDVSLSDVVDILESGEPVAIFQGRSEQGPRALGNRSLLFDPRVPDARTIMNKKKGRQPFRPFAATVLLEHVHDWFDMRGLIDSPYMMYAVDSLPEVRDIIPGVLHVDQTCRIQTVTEQENENYYNLIQEFYNKTKVPMLLNTSFNLSCDTICETVEDAVDTLKRSELNYLYFPEYGKMLHIPDNSNHGRRGTIYYGVWS